MQNLQLCLSNLSNDKQSAYLAGMTEAKLAKFQHAQVGNTCTLNCITSAIRLLTGRLISPLDLADELDALPFFHRLPYRGWRNGPVAPVQQVNLIRKLANDLGLPFKVSRSSLKPDILINHISQPGTVVMVTIGLWKNNAPDLTIGDGMVSYAPANLTWHTIIAAAFDPLHIDRAGQIKPWGFINSWVNGGDQLFWMTDSDFMRSWSFFTPLGGIRSAVIVSIDM
jgi:hypothetical protein